jgi:hypothetical protein
MNEKAYQVSPSDIKAESAIKSKSCRYSSDTHTGGAIKQVATCRGRYDNKLQQLLYILLSKYDLSRPVSQASNLERVDNSKLFASVYSLWKIPGSLVV